MSFIYNMQTMKKSLQEWCIFMTRTALLHLKEKKKYSTEKVSEVKGVWSEAFSRSAPNWKAFSLSKEDNGSLGDQ